MVAKIEEILEIHDPGYRKSLFKELNAIKSAVSALDSYQLLFKDMKVIRGAIAIPGFPIPVQEYIRMANAEGNVRRFASELNCEVVVLMGRSSKKGLKRRDLALVNINDSKLFAKCKKSLKDSPEFKFHQISSFMDGPVYEQLNTKMSRKELVPILNQLLT